MSKEEGVFKPDLKKTKKKIIE